MPDPKPPNPFLPPIVTVPPPAIKPPKLTGIVTVPEAPISPPVPAWKDQPPEIDLWENSPVPQDVFNWTQNIRDATTPPELMPGFFDNQLTKINYPESPLYTVGFFTGQKVKIDYKKLPKPFDPDEDKDGSYSYVPPQQQLGGKPNAGPKNPNLILLKPPIKHTNTPVPKGNTVHIHGANYSIAKTPTTTTWWIGGSPTNNPRNPRKRIIYIKNPSSGTNFRVIPK